MEKYLSDNMFYNCAGPLVGTVTTAITPPPDRPKTALLGISQLAEPLSRLHLSPSKAI